MKLFVITSLPAIFHLKPSAPEPATAVSKKLRNTEYKYYIIHFFACQLLLGNYFLKIVKLYIFVAFYTQLITKKRENN